MGARAPAPESRIVLTRAVRRALEITGLGLLAWAVLSTRAQTWRTAWDFETFYYAALALRHGLDPYRLDTLSALAGKPIILPFLYPPITLALFLPFTWLALPIATSLWLGLKLALAAALVALWRRVFLPEVGVFVLIVATVLAFDGSLLWDLRTGNVSVVEQLLLWLGFACYAKGRRRWFAALVVVASVFKLLPIAFLALLLVPSRDRVASPRLALLCLALFAGIVLLPAWLEPSWAHGYPGNLPLQRPYGERNPSALGILDMAFHGAPRPGQPDRALIGWALWAAALLALSAGRLARVWAERNPRRVVVTAVALFALLAPRMMIYSYLMLVPVTLALARERFERPAARAVALALVVAQGVLQITPSAWRAPALLALPPPAALLIANGSYFVTLALWLAWLASGRRRARR